MENNNLDFLTTDLVQDREDFIISVKDTCDKFSRDLFTLILEDENNLLESHTFSDDHNITEDVKILLEDLVHEFSRKINDIII